MGNYKILMTRDGKLHAYTGGAIIIGTAYLGHVSANNKREAVAKFRKLRKQTKIYISKRVVDNINATPPRECWMCDELAKNIGKDSKGYFIDTKHIPTWDDGFREHIKQLGWKRKVLLAEHSLEEYGLRQPVPEEHRRRLHEHKLRRCN